MIYNIQFFLIYIYKIDKNIITTNKDR